MALEVVNRLLANADLSDPVVLDNLVEMWNLGKLHSSHARFQENILNAIRLRATSDKLEDKDHYSAILGRIRVK